MFANYSRSLVWAVVGGLVALTAWRGTSQTTATGTNYVLAVATERPEAIYGQNEKVTFNIKLLRDQQPVSKARVRWKLSKDRMPPIKTGQLKVTEGRGTVSGKLGEPGFLQCQVTFELPNGSNVTAYAGAAIDPLGIKPSLPVPADFDSFWDAQKKALAEVPINPRLTREKSPASVELFDVQADCVGAPVSGYMARRVGAKAGSLPIILTVQGAGVRDSNRKGTLDWAQKGFLAMDINAHGIPNGKPDEFYTGLAEGELSDYRTRGRESRETVYFRGMFLRVVRALDFLTSQPEWDGRTVVVFGGSQGGAQAFAAAGLDSRVTFFGALVPAMCDHTGGVVGRISGWPKIVPMPKRAGGKPDPRVVEAVRYYDVVNFASRAKAEGFVTVGFIDETCPPTTVYAAYNALRGKKEIFNDPPSTHAISEPALEAARAAVFRHVKVMKR